MAKKTFVLDTNVYLTDSVCIEAFDNNDIVIPLKVLDEIDKHKKRQDIVGVHARSTIRKLDSYREKGNLSKGVRIGKGKGIIRVRSYDPFVLPDDLDIEDSDINMRVKCDSLGIQTEDFLIEKVVTDPNALYTGVSSILVDEQVIDQFYSDEEIILEKEQGNFYPNQYIMLISNSNDKKSALARFVNYLTPLKRPRPPKNPVWGMKPRNKEQGFALDLLLNPDVPVVTLVGKAGSGKTLLALAAALEQTFGTESRYNRVVVTKPVQPVGKDIGFLPGTMEEKMLPWLAPIQDNLQFLMGNDRMTLDMYMQEGRIEIEAMTFIRGRSISNSFIIIDEVQNMTQHEIKTVLTRVGEGTKIVLTGDIEQIDNVYIDATNNGLSYVVEKLKEHDISGHINLIKGERSKVATITSKVL